MRTLVDCDRRIIRLLDATTEDVDESACTTETRGEQGLQGETGARDIDGAKGSTGSKGDTGKEGATGQMGLKGKDGLAKLSDRQCWTPIVGAI